MKESVDRTSGGSRCRGTNRRGEPCQRLASEPGGLCVVHAGKQSMAEIGRLGGSRSPMTGLRRAAGQDAELRELARTTLEKALKGEDVDPPQLRAAQSLYAFRPSEAPRGRERP